MDETIKVTDKRMFNPDGSPRAEEPAASRDGAEAESGSAEPREAPEEAKEPATASEAPSEPATANADRADVAPQMPEAPLEAPEFPDLLGLLAQPVAMFLGDVQMPNGESAKNIPLARYHMQLLELLKTKTEGNLSPSEEKVFESLLYQLRLHFVEKSG